MNNIIRRKRKYVNWEKVIAKGNTNKFYKSTDWEIAREKALQRDKYVCQFYLGKWTDGKHKPNRIKVVRANTVHHIKPLKERPDLATDLDNLISLSHEAHEIVEERNQFQFIKRKKPLTKEKW